RVLCISPRTADSLTPDRSPSGWARGTNGEGERAEMEASWMGADRAIAFSLLTPPGSGELGIPLAKPNLACKEDGPPLPLPSPPSKGGEGEKTEAEALVGSAGLGRVLAGRARSFSPMSCQRVDSMRKSRRSGPSCSIVLPTG